MVITDPTKVCIECGTTHCKHYESDFDRFIKSSEMLSVFEEKLASSIKEEKENHAIAPNSYGTGVSHGEVEAYRDIVHSLKEI